METDRFTSAIIIVKNKNKHYTTTYKAIRNAFRKFGTFDNWEFSGSEKSVPYIYRDHKDMGFRQEILFRGADDDEDVEKLLSLEGERVVAEGDDAFSGGTRWLIIVDEVQTLKDKIIKTIFTKLDDSIRGTTRSGLPHQFFFLGNPPRHKDHFFNKLINVGFGTNAIAIRKEMEEKKYQEKKIENFLGNSLHLLRSTFLTTPKEFLGDAFVDKMRYYAEKKPDTYLREGLGIYVDGAGEVFDQFSIERNVFSYEEFIKSMGGELKVQLTISNLMKADSQVFFEPADTTFRDELKSQAFEQRAPYFKVRGPFNEKGTENAKMKVEFRTAGLNSAFENMTLMISDRCPNLIKELQESVFDEKKKEQGILVREKRNDHCLDGLEYTLSGYWHLWKNSKVVFDPKGYQSLYKIVLGGDFGDGGANKQGEGATTGYIVYYSPGFRRAFVLHEFYHKNKELPDHKKLGSKIIAKNLIADWKKFAEGDL